MNRRSFLKTTAAAAAAAAPLGAVPRSSMGLAVTCYMTARRPKDTIEFLDYSHSLGAGGIQAPLSSRDPQYLKTLRSKAEQYGMYLEIMTGLPTADPSGFVAILEAAKELNALCVRAACLGGRRYEQFATFDGWETFVVNSKAALARAVPLVEKAKMPLALENHKDWTSAEMFDLMKQYQSEYLGVCLDTGNNISLLDDPMAVVEQLAPWTISTHIKDMGVEASEDGFLLSEMPFGEGILDMKRVVETIRRARPKTKMTLEMITRDPLRVPCLSASYWISFPGREGKYLAQTLRMLGAQRKMKPLPRVRQLAAPQLLQLEEDNVKQCLTFGREQLGLG